jgi:hypothetical protein
MVTTTLSVIDANCYKLQLNAFATSVKKWHGELSDYAYRVEEIIILALDACEPGTDMTDALNTAGTKLREATEKLVSDALTLLECTSSSATGSTLSKYICALEKELKCRQSQGKENKVELKGKGAALVKTLRHINDLIGGAPHYKNESDEPRIKPVSFPDLIAALESFQRALEDVYASTQTLSEVKLKDSTGCSQYSIYNQDGVKDLRNKNAETLKKKLDDEVIYLDSAHLLEQHGLLTLPRTSHDSFAESVFSPTEEIASSKGSIKLDEALASKAPVILIQGEGGCGKTVALLRFGLKTNTDSECENIALYAKLDANFPSSAVKEQIAEIACYANDSRHIYILLDGLDEIHSKRSRVAEAIANLIDKYPRLFWRITTRELVEDYPEETRAWCFFRIEPFEVGNVLSGIQRLDQIPKRMRDHSVTLIHSEKPLASLLGTAFYYGLFCCKLLEFSQQDGITPDDEPRLVFRSHLLKFGLDKYVVRAVWDTRHTAH